MKYLLHLMPVVLGLAACQSNPTVTAVATSAPVKPTPALVASDSTETTSRIPEYVKDYMLTVNGQPHNVLTTQLLERQLGRPDSVAKGAVECGSELQTETNVNGDFWYYGRTMYEVSGNQAILHSFEVTTGKFKGKMGELILDKNTTLEDVRRFYPMSEQADLLTGGRSREEVNIGLGYVDGVTDVSLNLLFKKGRLQEVEFWSGC